MITFHVIYTPGTAIGLSRFALTLLQEPNCRLRLVSNGCTLAENKHLTDLCDQYDRLAYLQLPTEAPWPHHDSLNWLQANCDEPHFAIIDSDIFATGAFLSGEFSTELTCILPYAIFWDKTDEAFQRKRQRIGCTYFAIYNNDAVTQIRQSTNIGFERYQWDMMTTAQQQATESVGYKQKHFDTAKVLNAQLLASGGQLAFVDANNLHHLGGVSNTTKGSAEMNKPSKRLQFKRLVRRIRKYRVMPFPWILRKYASRQERKHKSGVYFAELLRALANSGTLPQLPQMGSRYVEEKMQAVTIEIVKLYNVADHNQVQIKVINHAP